MGDIYRRVLICGVRDGKRARCRVVRALLDTGATMSVVSPRLATRLGGQLIPQSETIEGRDLDSMAAELQVRAPDCGRRRRTVVVDAVLAAKAGPRAEMILGNDYMQRTDMAVLLSDRKAREGVACRRLHKRRK